MRVDNSRIRTTKLRVQKDIDTCGRGQSALSPDFLKFYNGTFFVLHLLGKFSNGRPKSSLSAIQHSRKQNLTLLTLKAIG